MHQFGDLPSGPTHELLCSLLILISSKSLPFHHVQMNPSPYAISKKILSCYDEVANRINTGIVDLLCQDLQIFYEILGNYLMN